MDNEQVGTALAVIAEAEARFRATVEGFREDELTEPSLCEGWTRGHVVAHVALNARSIVNLITWARTGKETPQYPSREARAEDIERYSTRTVTEHLEALDAGAQAFRDAAEALPPERWDFLLKGIGSDEDIPVSEYLKARRNEVEYHHVDLDAGYGSTDWPLDFVRSGLEGVPWRIGDEVEEPFSINATDLDMTLTIGDGEPTNIVTGEGHALLLWLIGRGRGDGLTSNRGFLPPLPSWG